MAEPTDRIKNGGDIVFGTSFGRRRSDLNAVKALDNAELIQHEGKQGLFTPLTNPEDPGLSETNLQQLMLSMREEIKHLQLENLDLRQRVDAERLKRRRTPDDFATAISHSVDSLQTRLHEMKNPVSRFAVKELELNVSLHAEVTELGTVEYRFIQPEEDIDSKRLTQMKLNLVPVPRDTDTGSWRAPDFTPFTDLEEIQGIGEAYQHKLKEHNLYTISDLLTAGTRVRSKAELASLLEVDHQRLSQWLSHAELMTVKEIDGRSAEVLHDIGVDHLETLAGREAKELAQTYNKRVKKVGHGTLKNIDETTAEKWISTARAFAGTQ